MGDARNEVIAAYAAAAGTDQYTIRNILQSNTTDEATEILKKNNLTRPTYDRIAQKIYTRVTERTKNKIKFNIIIVAMDGTVLGTDENGRSLLS
jgi:cobalt-precorrin-5B (C1)-methyltransferase